MLKKNKEFYMNKKYLSIPFLIIILLISTNFILYSSVEVYFSPDDHPTHKLIDLINKTQKRIHAAIYMLTDGTIANALVSAKQNRNVDVKIIVDQSSVESEYGKVTLLKSNNIDIFVFYPQNTSGGYLSQHIPLMHNKFAILDDCLWTGSFNWTRSANTKNQENVVIIYDVEVCEKFEKQFLILQKRCFPYKLTSREKNNQKEKGLLVTLKQIIYEISNAIRTIFQ
jgi:phosphatidylserine/phosphatidylglycerophosphate/cardiolipin synthase-like enzyme